MERATVHVQGVVQSVGFRPFVYRTATTLGLDGTVRNLGDAGVRIQLEGPGEAIDAFLEALREENPPLARVQAVDVDRGPVDEPAFSGFEILASEGGGGGGGTIPPDTAMCEACLDDTRDPGSRYHEYWATSCVDCGPRFTVVHDLPYDRPTTSMAAFPMCPACRDEYEDPTDRRHHAQTIACPDCGPSLAYGETTDPPSDPSRPPVDARDPYEGLVDPASGSEAVEAAAQRLRRGGIVVVKGIGGAHLACDATDPGAVEALRDRTGRSEKPFAVMAPDREAVEAVARVGEAAWEALSSPRRPILLLHERAAGPLVGDQVVPGLHTVGLMLPYTGLHHLLFDEIAAPLVMTSANLPGEPMHVHNGEILAALEGVADGFLLHDRTIVARCDDSVGRRVDGETRWIRRSRGHVPVPVPLPGPDEDARVLALGPQLDLAAAVLDGTDCYLTQYVGHVDDPATLTYLERAVDHLLALTSLETPPVVACDLHPDFETTRLARRLQDEEAGIAEVRQVQHHHAHAASVLAEHHRDAAIAVTVDGVGYGPDGTVWGGEVLDATPGTYERVAGLSPMPMPGGDRATRYPSRTLAGALHAADRADLEAVLAAHGSFPDGTRERDLVLQQIEKGVNTPTTTSAGRFLDAASALLGVCHERTYEGEPAMRLEAAAAPGEPLDVDVPRTQVDGRPAVDAPALLSRLVDRLEDGAARADVAATAQETLATGLADLAVEAARDRGRDAVLLTGGVAYNEHVHGRVRRHVEAADLTFLSNEAVPPGDGGIAYGQAAVAAARGPPDR